MTPLEMDKIKPMRGLLQTTAGNMHLPMNKREAELVISPRLERTQGDGGGGDRKPSLPYLGRVTGGAVPIERGSDVPFRSTLHDSEP